VNPTLSSDIWRYIYGHLINVAISILHRAVASVGAGVIKCWCNLFASLLYCSASHRLQWELSWICRCILNWYQILTLAPWSHGWTDLILLCGHQRIHFHSMSVILSVCTLDGASWADIMRHQQILLRYFGLSKLYASILRCPAVRIQIIYHISLVSFHIQSTPILSQIWSFGDCCNSTGGTLILCIHIVWWIIEADYLLTITRWRHSWIYLVSVSILIWIQICWIGSHFSLHYHWMWSPDIFKTMLDHAVLRLIQSIGEALIEFLVLESTLRIEVIRVVALLMAHAFV